MNTSQKMFILAAQEMNFSRAAEKAFVTPQCLSDHIKRLEEHYRVQLFVRRPHLQLTPEGQAMLRCFLRIQALEDSMKNELADISGGVRGTIRLGVPATRGAILIPRAVAGVNVGVRIGDADDRLVQVFDAVAAGVHQAHIVGLLGVRRVSHAHPFFCHKYILRKLVV